MLSHKFRSFLNHTRS